MKLFRFDIIYKALYMKYEYEILKYWNIEILKYEIWYMKYEIWNMKYEMLKINLLHKEDKKVDHVYYLYRTSRAEHWNREVWGRGKVCNTSL